MAQVLPTGWRLSRLLYVDFRVRYLSCKLLGLCYGSQHLLAEIPERVIMSPITQQTRNIFLMHPRYKIGRYSYHGLPTRYRLSSDSSTTTQSTSFGRSAISYCRHRAGYPRALLTYGNSVNRTQDILRSFCYSSKQRYIVG